MRLKRFIPLILLAIVVDAVTYLVMDEVVDYYNPNSTHNTVVAMQEREQTTQKNMDAIIEKWKHHQSVEDNTTALLESIVNELEAHRVSIKDIEEIYPDLAWKLSKIVYKIHSEAELIKRIVSECKKGHVTIQELASLTGINELRDASPDQLCDALPPQVILELYIRSAQLRMYQRMRCVCHHYVTQ